MHKVRILLVKAPICSFREDENEANFATRNAYSFQPSYALACISAFLLKYLTLDFNLKVIDFNEFIGNATEDDLIENFKSHIENVMSSQRLDILLVSAQYMFNQPWVSFIVNLSKKYNPESKVIVGGGFSTIFPQKAISYQDVDFAVIGEGEYTAVHIINEIYGIKDPHFQRQFPFDGYIKKVDGGYHLEVKQSYVKDLTCLPTPDWSWMNFRKYSETGVHSYLPIMTTRGCPNNCTYCSTRLYWGRGFRYRKEEDVVAEIYGSYEKHEIKHFHVIDDNPAFNNTWFLNFCDLLNKLPIKLSITFSNFSIKTINDKILKALRQIGFNSPLSIAIETGSSEMQKMINKRLNLDSVNKTVKLIRDEGFALHICWMIGFPGETLDQINETIQLARQLKSESVQVYPVFPFPGTQLYDMAKENKLINFDVNDFESMRYQVPGKILSDEWDGTILSEISYDANIEMNFLNSPLLESDDGCKRLKVRVETLTKRLTGHVVAHIVLGYLDRNMSTSKTKTDYHYIKAKKYLEEADSQFAKYLSWNSKPIMDYLQWLNNINKN
ncbi:MAG TPA: B12-binding domain-containing radical SAM protein [Nitrospirae bacterium]|nr:B12-binding domain-containing radical SAM protein [Nitrospirota bacterium]